MQVYYTKVVALHPDFPGQYRSWTGDEHNAVKFSPEEFNRQYNAFREVSSNI